MTMTFGNCIYRI